MADAGILTLPDGARVLIREVGGDDRAALLAGFERLSAESRRHRFFTAMPRLPESFVDHLTDVDQNRHVALGVFDPERPSDVGSTDGLGVAVGHYFVSAGDPARAEAALSVIDEYQGRGIGTLLLQSLLVVARQRGIQTFTAYVRSDNASMAAVLAGLGAATTVDSSDPEELVFEVAVPDAAEPLKSTASYRVMRELARSG